MGRGAFLPVLPASIIGRQTINLEMKSEELETSGISRTRWVRVLCVWPGFRVPGGKPAGGAAQEALGPGPCRREHLPAPAGREPAMTARLPEARSPGQVGGIGL